MTDLKFCFPEDVPSQFASFDGKFPQMDVGKTGIIGFLKLTLESDSQRNKTIITEQLSRVPLYVQKALYYDETIPSMASYLFCHHLVVFCRVTDTEQISS